jgi:hypothetical protein
MTNSFARFGINYLSPSSLNMWRSAPGIWAHRYIAKIKDGGNAAMWRGTAVENGMAALLRGLPLEAAQQAAQTSFEMNAQGEVSDDIDAERAMLSPMIEQCQLWTAPSPLNASQLKVEHWLDDIPVPVVGYLDFGFDGIDIDLKTTKACPSTPRADHVRQVALYRASRNRKGGVLYVTAKRYAYFEIDDEAARQALSDLQSDALSLNNFLARCDSPRDVLKSLPVDWDHFAAPKIRVPLSQILLAG